MRGLSGHPRGLIFFLDFVSRAAAESTGQLTPEEAIGVARQAVAATPDDRPDRAGKLNDLGNKLGHRYERTGAMADLDNASLCLQQAWDTDTSVPFHRV